jgi:capsule polysaccharide export protein KpsE/RkpR
MSSYKPGDSKKEEFRKYLEKAGVLDALTKTLVSLYEEPEKPNNALDFLRKNLFSITPDTPDILELKNEIENLHFQLDKSKSENEQMRERLAKYEPQVLEENK